MPQLLEIDVAAPPRVANRPELENGLLSGDKHSCPVVSPLEECLDRQDCH
jgi:hypothetical protein